jgi:hypothetical protein
LQAQREAPSADEACALPRQCLRLALVMVLSMAHLHTDLSSLEAKMLHIAAWKTQVPQHDTPILAACTALVLHNHTPDQHQLQLRRRT